MRLKVAVTGPSGFIGHYVIRELIGRGHDVVLISRSGKGIEEFKGNSRVEVKIFDILTDSPSFKDIGLPDVLLHLAWGGLPNYFSRHHFETELPAHYRFIKNLIYTGLKKVVSVGTCFEYGMKSGELSEEEDTNPHTTYGLGKDMLRRQIEFLKLEHDFEFSWARLFYIWGDGQSSTSLFKQVTNAITFGAEQFDMSKGDQTRDYLPVGEVASYLVDLCEIEKGVGSVNICSGRPVSVKEMVLGWFSDAKVQIEINDQAYPYPTYEPLHFWGNSEKLEKLVSGLQSDLRSEIDD